MIANEPTDPKPKLRWYQYRLWRLSILVTAIVIRVFFTLPVVMNVIAQRRNLANIRRHIEAIQPQWEQFRSQNPGFEDVEFFAGTGGNGMFGASGHLPSQEHLQKLKRFMEDSNPPRAVNLRLIEVLDEESFDLLVKKKLEP